MGARSVRLTEDPDELQRLLRILASSVNVAILRTLVRARRANPDEGWMFLSEIAAAVDEKPGTIGIAIQKLVGSLVEERREKGKRYFRSSLRELTLEVTDFDEGTRLPLP